MAEPRTEGSESEELDPGDCPLTINPYKTLGLYKTATSADVKTSYKKLALKNHPDKVAPEHRDIAHVRFQEIAFAYAILSDPIKRDRYDASGSTYESTLDDFDWVSFFREQHKEMVNRDRLDEFKSTYQGSEREKRDVLYAYEWNNGSLDGVFQDVVCSNSLEDEGRFRKIIDEAIDAGNVEKLGAYVNESKKTKERRKKKAERESAEAIQHAKDLGLYDEVFGRGKKEDGGTSGLASLILQRQQHRADTFFNNMEAKYGGKGAATSKNKGNKRTLGDMMPKEDGKTRNESRKHRPKAQVVDESGEADKWAGPLEEPLPKEKFRATEARTRQSRKAKRVAEDSDEEESLGDEDTEEEEEGDEIEQDENGEDEEEILEEKPMPAKRAKRNSQQQKGRPRIRATAKAKAPTNRKPPVKAKVSTKSRPSDRR